MSNPLALQDVDNEVLRSADEYLRKHKILELFEVSYLIPFNTEPIQDLTTLVCYKKLDSQDELKQFLIEQVEARKAHGSRSIVFTDSELQNIFTLYDLKGSGQISKEQCREGKYFEIFLFKPNAPLFITALKTLANSEYHFTKAQETNIPQKVDLFTFMKICDEVLGIKAK